MLGEGFDHQKLSVAAIFRPFRSLAPYIQFVGRIMRVIVQNDPGHPDNLGHIVTHLGMYLQKFSLECRDQILKDTGIEHVTPPMTHKNSEFYNLVRNEINLHLTN